MMRGTKTLKIAHKKNAQKHEKLQQKIAKTMPLPKCKKIAKKMIKNATAIFPERQIPTQWSI